MFQVGLSCPLALVFTATTLLAACAMPVQPTTAPKRETATVIQVCDCKRIQEWLDLQQKVSSMSIEETTQELDDLGQPNGSEQLFYYGLLNQRLDIYTSWIEARNTFRALSEDTSLAPYPRQLASILERYNQSRINWYLQRKKLEDDVELLNQKIEAITELESSMSTRREQ